MNPSHFAVLFAVFLFFGILILLALGHHIGARRLAADYRKLPDLAAAQAEWEHSVQLQDAIWTNAIAACRVVPTTPPTMLLLPSLNQTFDIAGIRPQSSM